ncbi:MAG: peptidoglycan recognition family protein [Planctomycetota bacterium]|nr:peptidoglycan recognition family protein [Planctomycetota bacterium]
MTRARTAPTRTTHPTKRTSIVWMSFFAAMTIVTGLLMLKESSSSGQGYLVAANLSMLNDTQAGDGILQTSVPLDLERWSGIVIHHSSEPAGDPESMRRLHESQGLQGLGYHFLIGNGNGLGDGVIHVGYRWNEQLPGAHVAGPMGTLHNHHSIGICLIGNGDRRAFTEAQMARLINLIQRLQRELNIPADQIHLSRNLTEGTTSPGRFFSTAQLSEQLVVQPR